MADAQTGWTLSSYEGVKSSSETTNGLSIEFSPNTNSQRTYTVTYRDNNGNCGQATITQEGGGSPSTDYHFNITIANNSNSDVYITGEALVYFNGESVGVLLTNDSEWGVNNQIKIGKKNSRQFSNCRVTRSKGCVPNPEDYCPEPSQYTASTYNFNGIAIYSSYADITDNPECKNSDGSCKSVCNGIYHTGDKKCYDRESDTLKTKSGDGRTDISYSGTQGPLKDNNSYTLTINESFIRPTQL